jgi:putative addiction module killer protein
MSNVKGVGSRVFELRIDFGPGLPGLFRQRRRASHHLARGGTKQRQQRDINAATANWEDYKRRK